jgi:NADPH:quinone reductase
MHEWLCETASGADDLRWVERPTPTPGDGDVLVEIRAASLNFPDLLIVQGKYQMKPTLPFVPGSEFAGTVLAVGAGVRHLKAGQGVACLSSIGAFATHAVVNALLCVPLPPGFPMLDAAAFIVTYATSHHALIDRAKLTAGETVLVLGARVIAAASSAAKCALCTKIGADATIDTSSQPLRDGIKELTGGKGPDVIYDPVGGEQTEAAFRSIAWRGRHLVIGFASGPIPALPLNLALLKGASIVGVFWGEYTKREPRSAADMMLELMTWYGQGKIKPVIDATMPMTELKAAFARMASREVRGKVVLVNG